MTNPRFSAFFASGSGVKTHHVGRGSVYSLLASTALAATDAITLYDSASTSGTVLLSLDVPANGFATWFHFPNDKPLVFTEGLTVDPGNCNVLLVLTIQ